MMVAPLFLNKAGLAQFAVAESRDSAAEGKYLETKISAFTGME